MLHDLIIKNRSYRRFYEEKRISDEILVELIDMARLSASAANLQPLKYIISSDKKKNGMIFNSLAWAAYLKDWECPVEGERPSAYIILLRDNKIAKSIICDQGISGQTILLGAVERGFGGCILAAVNRKRLTDDLNIPGNYTIEIVIALGKPKEMVVIEKIDKSGSIKYWRDKTGVHHVPKRSLDEIILMAS